MATAAPSIRMQGTCWLSLSIRLDAPDAEEHKMHHLFGPTQRHSAPAPLSSTAATNLARHAHIVALALLVGSACTAAPDAPAAGCLPGTQVACPCPGGSQGVQVCLPTGNGFGPCSECSESDAQLDGSMADVGDVGPGKDVGVGPGCFDNVQNGLETDVDCGGALCLACAAGLKCAAPGDCASAACASGICADTGGCTDSKKNGGESDVDCGGPCPACVPGKHCAAATDCTSKICLNALCTGPTCSDQVKNGKETALDCGGGDCIPCPVGSACKVGTDCLGQLCQNGLCKAQPACTDGAKNGSETDVDCGGGKCNACLSGETCQKGADCASLVCKNSFCLAPTCTDNVKNGSETDVDCGGGACSKCQYGLGCNAAPDCSVPNGDLCFVPSCSAGVCVKQATSCDDGNPCTYDSCDKTNGCAAVTVADGANCGAGPNDICQAGICGCGPGREPVKIDDGGVPKIACAALGPVWGARPDNPVGVYKLQKPAGGVDEVVYDTQTKLMWQRVPSKTTAWPAAKIWCGQFAHAGFKDWRLPTVHELASLVSYGLGSDGGGLAAIDQGAFPNSLSDFWSATPIKGSASVALSVEFNVGNVSAEKISGGMGVRCVRGSAGSKPKPVRYVIGVTGETVTDSWTELEWMRDMVAGKQNQAYAKVHCGGLKLGGKTDWRLPGVRELYGLVDYQTASPTIDSAAFPGTKGWLFWSASLTHLTKPPRGWLVNFSNGTLYHTGTVGNFHVRCVRGN